MAQGNIDQSTDTHLSKKYNDIVYDCIMRCNAMGFLNNSSPHFNHLQNYYGAVNILFINTFMLFEYTRVDKFYESGVVVKDESSTIAKELYRLSQEVESEMNLMKNDASLQTKNNFQATTDKCKNIHKMVMYGLQKRNMLVRVSENEPRGRESINFWEQKVGFMKGGVKGDDEVNLKNV